jgi:Phosphotransferase enzyme family
MDDGRLPVWVLRDAGLKVLPGDIRPREGRAWLVDWQGTRAILRKSAAPPSSVLLARLRDDMTWLHVFLTSLAKLGFPSPWPLPAFDGESWTVADGMLWEVVSFIPGHAVGWAAEPSMEEIGALLGRYHVTVRQIEVTGQRPGALPLADVPEILLSPRLEAARVDPDRAAVIRDLATRLARDLHEMRQLTRERVVIHGDFTTDNVIAGGTPPRPTGVIDLRRPPVELGQARARRPQPARGGAQSVERGQGPVVRAAAARAGRRGPLRPHGGDPLPAHCPVRPVAYRPRSEILRVRPARGAGRLQPRGHPGGLTLPRPGPDLADTEEMAAIRLWRLDHMLASLGIDR